MLIYQAFISIVIILFSQFAMANQDQFATPVTQAAYPTVPFEFPIPNQQDEYPAKCKFTGLTLPENTKILVAGAYKGKDLPYQLINIDRDPTQIDVAVNMPHHSVVLMLGAYEPNLWNIGWSQGTEILAVLVSGYHHQIVAGLTPATRVLVSTYKNRGPCGYFYVGRDQLIKINPLANKLLGRNADKIFSAKHGKVVVGEPLSPQNTLITSPHTPPGSFYDKNAPRIGQLGIEDALHKGVLRKATRQDALQWVAVRRGLDKIPPVVGNEQVHLPRMPRLHDAYMILGDFTFPAGLYGSRSVVFFLDKAVAMPKGNPGHSPIYDLNTGNCLGSAC